MPYSSMSPTIVTRDGEVELVLGSPGSARILSAVTQVIQLWVHDTPIGEAVRELRVHALPDGRAFIEGPLPPTEVLDALDARGMELATPRMDLVTPPWNPYFGGVHAVAHEEGTWRAAADPRRDGTAFVLTLENDTH